MLCVASLLAVGAVVWWQELAADEQRQAVLDVRDRWLASARDRVRAVGPRPEDHAWGGHAYAGFPAPDGYPYPITILTNRGYVVGYCEKRQNPVWSSYRIFALAAPEAEERPRRFRLDERTSSRVTHDDYTRSGYDRGHLAPSYAIGTRYGREAQLETFFMSNICPQKGRLNQGAWRLLEERIAKDYAAKLEEVWVVTGPIFDADRTWLPRTAIEIPDAFYKIVLDEENGAPRVLAFILDQRDTSKDFERYLTTVDTIELRTGLNFFSDLPDDREAALESSRATALWQ